MKNIIAFVAVAVFSLCLCHPAFSSCDDGWTTTFEGFSSDMTTALTSTRSYILSEEEMEDVSKALSLSLEHLAVPTGVTLEYRTPAQRLRDLADEIEKQDKDLDFIKNVYESIKSKLP